MTAPSDRAIQGEANERRLSVVGRSVKRADVIEKGDGRRQVRRRTWPFPASCTARSSDAQIAHARIAHIDVSPALALLGVKAVLTHADVPRVLHAGSPHPRSASVTKDQYILDDRVRYWGEGVAAVAASSEEIAEEALDLIAVDYEPLPAVFTLEEAMAEGRRNCTRTAFPATTCCRRSSSGAATWRTASPKPISSSRANTGSGGRRRPTWSRTFASVTGISTASSRSGPRRNRPSWCAARLRRCSAYRSTRCACSSTIWVAASAASRTFSSMNFYARCWRGAAAGRSAWNIRARRPFSAGAPAIPAAFGLNKASATTAPSSRARRASSSIPAPTARMDRASPTSRRPR